MAHTNEENEGDMRKNAVIAWFKLLNAMFELFADAAGAGA